MGVELLKIAIKMRRGVVFTIRGCSRSVCNHPFLVVLLSVLIYMYRSSPFMFSLLVSASPILVCTAVLLGTLLFFGQSNLPDIEIEEKTAHEAMALKTELSKDSVLVEKNESYCVERFSEKRRNAGEQPIVASGLSESKVDEICRESSVGVIDPLNNERSRENESVNGEVLEARRGFDDGKLEKQKAEWNEERLSDGEVMENNYASIPKASDIESEYEKSEADSYDSERVNVDSVVSSAWNKVEQREDEEEAEEDDDSGSGSDQAESSSPDASMADIIPMLDELHPLLDEEGTHPVQMSRVGSNAPSSPSTKSSSNSIESVDENDNQDDSEVADDDIDNEDGEEEEDDDDAQGDKEDQRKAAITWTEEDQKNLMDLGSSEIERNQRLEHLLMRRRTRKNISMVPEIDLIDLEGSEFPIHVASINTTRQNPFDLPHDSYDYSGLPPIPGSAPSILLPSRNPFDIPYDSNEEKPNQMGDGLQEEVKTSQSRDPFFRRRESFNVGPSVFVPNRQDLKWRPYFVPERMVLEESSYSPLQRQSSEMSSIPETESVSSVEDLEDRKLDEESDPQEVIEEGPLGDQDQVSKRESSEENESQSSEGVESLELGSVEKRDIDHVEDHYEEGSVDQPDSSSEAVEQKYNSGSGTSSLSEASERVFIEIGAQDLSMSDNKTHDVLDTEISRHTSDLSITSTLVNDVPHKEPVYDSSPRASSNACGQDSINSDFSVVDEKSGENFTDQQTQGDKNLGEFEENPLPISERESPTADEGRLEVEHSVGKGETVQSPNSGDNYHEANEKISTPTARGSTSHFYGRAMHESEFEHVQEVQVPNTPVESRDKVRSIQNIHIPGLHELHHDVSPNSESSFDPDPISKPSEEAVSHVDTQTILEEAADVIKENHAGLLSESDGEHVDSADSTEIVEANSVDSRKTEHVVHLENRRDEIVNDIREVTDEDVHSTTSDKEKGDPSKSSSSSSSDSEENKKMMSAKRRLSTPF